MAGSNKQVTDEVNRVATYVCAPSGWSIPATPTDMVTITGAAGKIIRILAIIVTGTQTTAGVNKIILVKRSTADTGGTAVADTIVPLDSGDVAASAVVNHYTANPGALGTIVGNVGTENLLCPAPAGTTDDKIFWIFLNTGSSSKELLLKSATEQVAINFAGATLPVGLSLNVEILWTEE